jgi:hypothetical protein
MVTWTNHALAQLRHIHDYIAEDSPFYAKRVIESLASKECVRGANNPIPHILGFSIREKAACVLSGYQILL